MISTLTDVSLTFFPTVSSRVPTTVYSPSPLTCPWPCCSTCALAVRSTNRANKTPIKVTKPAKGKSFQGCFDATWQSESAP
ncbi:hypothetical protein OIU77_028602 [Salix suchowensis]|uniref:Uncharacterized protein n=1 Tax=Salix suchowensis TaxID=1278906 RepID=A0ABQ9BLV4_9ROSI|nr:hypothetical protein OIU77_028602 [Salix suchowensis]